MRLDRILLFAFKRGTAVCKVFSCFFLVGEREDANRETPGARQMFGARWLFFEKFPGGHRRGDTPVPMPNTAVKPSTADGTARVASWESRSLPGFFCPAHVKCAGLFRFLLNSEI